MSRHHQGGLPHIGAWPGCKELHVCVRCRVRYRAPACGRKHSRGTRVDVASAEACAIAHQVADASGGSGGRRVRDTNGYGKRRAAQKPPA
jgi:hypothetical protein